MAAVSFCSPPVISQLCSSTLWAHGFGLLGFWNGLCLQEKLFYRQVLEKLGFLSVVVGPSADGIVKLESRMYGKSVGGGEDVHFGVKTNIGNGGDKGAGKGGVSCRNGKVKVVGANGVISGQAEEGTVRAAAAKQRPSIVPLKGNRKATTGRCQWRSGGIYFSKKGEGKWKCQSCWD